MTDHDKHPPDQPESDRPELDDPLDTAPESDAAAESAAAESDTFEQAADDLHGTGEEAAENDEEPAPEAEPEPPLERLQKILAKSGVASRRHAEELITSGRVQVNGKVVTELGSKADPARDHIRVDGKLLQGSERHRYFMLNKPKGYVTTVSDPEGRPTIMEFFSKTRERLYPVGRLDYLSEGLLLVTNDGELANKLTRAASNVEKTYLVKVSGQPSEEDLDRLRQGVPIAKGKPGSSRVHTAPAEIRPFRPGKPAGKKGPSRPVDNPWYEVVLIEGRNRELRKMFEEIGHHVEKIRRVGYGPLVLDLEPGKTRELEPEELENLRKAAEGKYRKPKRPEPRKREFTPRSDRTASNPHWKDRRAEGEKSRSFGGGEERRPFRGNRPGSDQRPQASGRRPPQREGFRRDSRPDSGGGEPRREFRPGGSRPNPRFTKDRPPQREEAGRPQFRGRPGDRNRFDDRRGQRPFQREDRPMRSDSRPPRRDASSSFEPKRPERREQFEGRPPRRPTGSRPFSPGRSGDRPTRPQGQSRFDRPRSQDRDQNRPTRPDRTERNARPRLDISPIEDRNIGQGDQNRPPRRDRPPLQDNQRSRSFHRPRSEDRGASRGKSRSGQAGEARSDRPSRDPNRTTGQRSSSSRPTGKFKGGNRKAGSGKQGSVRSSGGRRPGNKRHGSKPGKRRP